jgi:hypothetical protein
MTLKQIWSHEVTYHPEGVQDRSRGNTSDYRVYVPDKIEKLELGKDEYAIVEKKTQDGLTFLVGRKLTEEDDEDPDSDNTSQVFTDGSTRLRITISTDWIDDLLEHDGDDALVVEINEISEEFRVYKYDDYDQRKDQLKDQGITPRVGQPVIVPVAAYTMATDSNSSKTLREGFGADIDDEGLADSDNSKSLREGFGDDIDDEGPATSSN